MAVADRGLSLVSERETAELAELSGRRVLVTGAGVSGRSIVGYLRSRGAQVTVADRNPPADLPDGVAVIAPGDPLPAGIELVVTSPGWRHDSWLLVAAQAAGIEVIGDVELAVRADNYAKTARPSRPSRPWLVVTGTNGKTTTIGMVESILRAAGKRAVASGNVGLGILDAVAASPEHEVIAAELSSFQLDYTDSLVPAAGAVLNLAEDHLDWHGSMDAYRAAKAKALIGPVAVAVVDDANAAQMLADSPAARKIAVSAGEPVSGWSGSLGVRGGQLIDEAFGAGTLVAADEIRPAGSHNLSNALTAAALCLSIGITGQQVAAGLRAFEPGGHRNVLVGTVDGVGYVNDSKATNPHAARASLLAYPRVVWIAGGQLKGAAIDDLVAEVADRLAGVVLLGADAAVIDAALARHAPEVPRKWVSGTDHRVVTGAGVMNVGVMNEVVRQAAAMAHPGDVVLLAPAAASLDMFTSYGARGDAFADAVEQLAPGLGDGQ